MDILVLPGDDIGPEITVATRTVLDAADAVFELGLRFEEVEVGMARHAKEGTTLPDGVVDMARQADGVLLGPAGMTAYPPLAEGGVNVPGTIRKQLDLYANIRPAKDRGLPDGRAGLDCLIVRENTEGFYADRNMFMGSGEFMPTEDVALAVRKITKPASERIARVAFEQAARRRKDVTSVGKRHVLQITDGVFMRAAEAEAARNPDIAYREIDIDAAAAAVYTHPQHFDVILITNMYGDILSNLVVALSGSLGLAAALNVGDGHAVANAGHGSAPDIAGKGIANPTGFILSAAMLLDWLGAQNGSNAYAEASAAVTRAVDVALADVDARTGDVAGNGNTASFANAVAAAVKAAG